MHVGRALDGSAVAPTEVPRIILAREAPRPWAVTGMGPKALVQRSLLAKTTAGGMEGGAGTGTAGAGAGSVLLDSPVVVVAVLLALEMVVAGVGRGVGRGAAVVGAGVVVVVVVVTTGGLTASSVADDAKEQTLAMH